MGTKRLFVGESFATVQTNVWLETLVFVDMTIKVDLVVHDLSTDGALQGRVGSVFDFHVLLQACLCLEMRATLSAGYQLRDIHVHKADVNGNGFRGLSLVVADRATAGKARLLTVPFVCLIGYW